MKTLSTGLLDKLSAKGITECEIECQKSIDACTELVASTKTALDDLFAARVTAMQDVNKKRLVDQRG